MSISIRIRISMRITPCPVAPIRANLISKGMIYSQSHGDNSFTVPLFDAYMKRVMPELL